MAMLETAENAATRRIYAVRHGQSEWNVLYKTLSSEADRYSPRMKTIDCDITALGKEQSLQAGMQLAEKFASTKRKIDLMMISPLRRALQTASHVLEAFPENERPVVEICELCSEVLLDACDIGTVPTELAREFPQWDFSNLDPFWWHGGMDPEQTWALLQQKKVQETEEEVEKRMNLLKKRLRSLKGDTIVLICHSDVICWLTSELKENGERLGTYPKNGEIVDITRHIEWV